MKPSNLKRFHRAKTDQMALRAAAALLLPLLLSAACVPRAAAVHDPGAYAAGLRDHYTLVRAVEAVMPGSASAVLSAAQVEALIRAVDLVQGHAAVGGDAAHLRGVTAARTAPGGASHELDVVLERAAGSAAPRAERYVPLTLAVSAGGTLLDARARAGRGASAASAAPAGKGGGLPPGVLHMDDDDWNLIVRAQEANCSDWSRAWHHCAPGTLSIPPRLAALLAFQRSLEDDVPVADATWLGTHNSYNARGDGYGVGDNVLNALIRKLTGNETNVILANQEFSMTDQLNMGVRFVEVDPHYVFGEVRMCHAGGAHLWWLDDILWLVGELTGHTIDFDSAQIGCAPFDRPFESGIAEIAEWLARPENAGEVVVLYLDDDAELQEWGKLDLVLDPLQRHFGNMTLPVGDIDARYGGRWPSRRQLVADGRRVIVANNLDYGPPYDEQWFGHFWKEQLNVNNLTYPVCKGAGGDEGVWRFLSDSTIYSVFYNGPARGLINETTLPLLYRCGVTFPCTDQLSPYLGAFSVWSWAPGQPAPGRGANESCTAVSAPPDGRWFTAPCAESRPVACRSNVSDAVWVVTWLRPEPFATAASACPEGFAFVAPRNGFETYRIADTAGALDAASVWINHVADPERKEGLFQ